MVMLSAFREYLVNDRNLGYALARFKHGTADRTYVPISDRVPVLNDNLVEV